MWQGNPVAAKLIEIFARLLISVLIFGSVFAEQWLVGLAVSRSDPGFQKNYLGKNSHGRDEMIDQRLAPWATLLLRVSLGSLFIAHLYWKFAILDGGLDKWWAQFAANGYPAITPWYCLSAEFAGALLLIPGIWTRWVALYTLPLIFGAAQFWAVRKGFYFTIGGAEMSLTWGLMLILQVLLGDGPYAAVPSPMPRMAGPKTRSA
jgi:putative oxidoreductase